jgi:lysophospholipase L1-like esterase
MRTRLVVSTLTLAAVTLAAAAVTRTADAAVATDYVALGDSYSSGVAAGSYDGASGNCRRSANAYPKLWVGRHSVSSFSFPACSGATTSGVLSGQVSALSAATDLVTISIGGNDADFAGVVGTCRTQSDSACRTAVTTSRTYITTTLPGRLDQTYQAIRSKAPNARVVVLGYPRIFETGSCGIASISLSARTQLNDASDVLSGVISARARAAGFSYADVRGRFSGHGVCAADAWITGTVIPIGDSYHPKANGHASGYLPALEAITG